MCFGFILKYLNNDCGHKWLLEWIVADGDSTLTRKTIARRTVARRTVVTGREDKTGAIILVGEVTLPERSEAAHILGSFLRSTQRIFLKLQVKKTLP